MNIRRFTSFLFNFFAKIHFSQHGEDTIIRKLFDKNLRSGFYLDIGAHHPFRHSNTAYFWLKGWNGVNVDANTKSIQAFNKIRKSDKNILMAVVDTETAAQQKTISLNFNPNVDYDLGASCDQVTTVARSDKLTSSVEVACDSMLNIVNQYAPLSTLDFHFMNIDIEGFDERALASLPQWRVKPQVICIEIIDSETINDLMSTKTHKILSDNGYQLKGKTGISSIYQLGQPQQ